MKRDETPAGEQGATAVAEKVFTVLEANSALVLVRRIVEDVVTRYRRLVTLREQRQALADMPGQIERLEQINEQIAGLSETLAELHTELGEIGCVLKDWADGLVDFPATYRGRRVWLCWKIGDPAISYWHEMHAGFAGRQPIGPDFQ